MNQLSALQGKQTTSTLFHINDGYFFYCYQANDRAMYLRCSKFRSHQCPVRGVLKFGEGLHLRGIHSDDPDFGQVEFKTQRLLLIEEAKRLDVASIKDIFNNLPRNLPNGLTYHSMYPAMTRTRLSSLPEANSLVQVIAVLENPSYVCVTSTASFEDNIYRGSTQTQNGSHVLLFISDKCIASLKVAPHVTILRTVIAPEIIVLTICALVENNVIPHGWCLLNRSSPVEYSAAFMLLRNSLNQWHFVDGVCADEEVTQAFSSIFNLTLSPSLYDFISDIKTFVETTYGEIRQNYPLLKIIQLCCALPMLPYNLTQIGINAILAEAQTCNQLSYDAVRLFNYIELKWLRTLPNNFPVFGSSVRTLFGCEEMKSQIVRGLNGRNFYSIIRNFVATSETGHKHIKQLLNGHKLFRATAPPLMEDRDLQVLGVELVRPTFTLNVAVWNYLQAVSGKLQHIV